MESAWILLINNEDGDSLTIWSTEQKAYDAVIKYIEMRTDGELMRKDYETDREFFDAYFTIEVTAIHREYYYIVHAYLDDYGS